MYTYQILNLKEKSINFCHFVKQKSGCVYFRATSDILEGLVNAEKS